MAEEKSRVVRYAKKREEISRMDSYSFVCPPKKEDGKADLSSSSSYTANVPVDAHPENGLLSHNSATVTIDELLEEKQRQENSRKEKEARKALKKQELSRRRKKVPGAILAWIAVVLVLAVFVSVIVYLLLR